MQLVKRMVVLLFILHLPFMLFNFQFSIFNFQYSIALAQNPHLLTGQILDATTGEPVPFASCQYKGHNIGMVSDIEGNYSISRHNGWYLTFSAVGYVSQTILVNASAKNIVRVRLQPDNKVLKEVTVKAKKGRYSRKNNPAVELMRKEPVVADILRSAVRRYDEIQMPPRICLN